MGTVPPWLLVAAPITAILLVMTFWARPDWPQNGKIIYIGNYILSAGFGVIPV